MSNADLFEKVIVPMGAALLGAIVGGYFAHTSQAKSGKRNDKKVILAQLMGCRHDAGQDNDFVKALNMVVLIFHENKEIKDAVHHYLTSTGIEAVIYTNGQRSEAFFNILIEMGKDIGYTDLTRNDIRDYYIPSRPQSSTMPDTISPS